MHFTFLIVLISVDIKPWWREAHNVLVHRTVITFYFISFRQENKSVTLKDSKGGWTAVCKDSRKQFRPITIEKSHLAADREMNIPSIVGRLTNFVLFLVFRHRFVRKFLCWFSWALLIVLMRKSSR